MLKSTHSNHWKMCTLTVHIMDFFFFFFHFYIIEKVHKKYSKEIIVQCTNKSTVKKSRTVPNKERIEGKFGRKKVIVHIR